nr:NADH dehydrogenase subunit 6 [Appalachioria falcifera]AFR77034.2 NADH dehydrogenase subunit 6 [Appalachioria falcifera]
MVFSLLLFFSMVISVVFSQVVNPMLLAYLVVSGGVVVMVSLGLIFPTFWLSYIVLLTFLGGLLVLFVYVASLSPNEPVLGFGLGFVVVSGLILFFVFNWESTSDLGFGAGFMFLMSMYLENMGGFMVLLILYLFLVLLVSVDLSLIILGPLSVF